MKYDMKLKIETSCCILSHHEASSLHYVTVIHVLQTHISLENLG